MRIDLWTWRLTEGDERLLSDDERRRADNLATVDARARFVAGRARLREILGRRLGISPAGIAFTYGPHGRPLLAGIGFSLAHAGDHAALALGPGPMLGLDLERLQPVDPATAHQYLSSREQAEISALPADARDLARLRAWTRKEAVTKALGVGLAADFARVEVAMDPEPGLRACPGEDARRWHLSEPALAPGFLATLAVRADGDPVEIAVQDGP